jgi:hypothetical protein
MRVSIPKDTKCEIESDPEASKFEIDFSLPHAKRALCIIYNPRGSDEQYVTFWSHRHDLYDTHQT